jgi:peptidoglycan/LPS O-acetylase OafA/YrhL
MILRGTDYFVQTASPSPLQHTWSLGIEEQFYLLLPLVVLALLRWTSSRGRTRTSTTATAATPVSTAAPSTAHRAAMVERGPVEAE